jgi:hypothetical protein
MGFNKAANPDVVGTLKAAVDKINGLATPPEFMLHTGDISHLSKPEEFDTVDQILKSASAKDTFLVPGEHDVLNDDGKQYLDRYGKGTIGAGWYGFDKVKQGRSVLEEKDCLMKWFDGVASTGRVHRAYQALHRITRSRDL